MIDDTVARFFSGRAGAAMLIFCNFVKSNISKIMKKCVIFVLGALAACLLTACGGGQDFELDLKLKGLGVQTLQVTWLGDSGVMSRRVTAIDNAVHVEGNVTGLTLVNVTTPQGKVIARVVAEGGDRLSVTGDVNRPLQTTVKGNAVSERWQQFRSSNSALYLEASPARLDKAIETYMERHSSDPLSAVLLLADYSNLADPQHTARLMASLKPEAKPESLLASFKALDSLRPRSVSTLSTLLLCGTGGDFEQVVVTGHATLLYFWSKLQPDRTADLELLRKAASLPDVQVVDVMLDSDTTHWSNLLGKDRTAWRHCWAPGGPTDPSLSGLGIVSAPTWLLTDVNGQVRYNGASRDALQPLLKQQ